MKFKKQIILFIFFTFMNIIKIQSAPELGKDYPGIECGKKIKKEKDCTKYGTDSGMLCCYVKFNNGTEKCTLLYTKKADEFEIHGSKDFPDDGEYWSCGNKSFYLSINLFMILISIFLY